jgi:hypothetical protein
METLLKNNEALARMFLGPGVAYASSTWSRRTSIQHLAPEQGPSETPERNRRSFFDLSFEKDLIASRVYRRIKRDTMDFSMRSSVARSHGWSIFSGMSLSDISEISVLALPILPSDISNSQHYVKAELLQAAGELSLVPPSVYGIPIFHECLELEAQLLQLRPCSFKQMLERERSSADASSDILAALVSVFRRGRPLLQLYNQLDDSYQDRWKSLLSPALSPSSAKLAVVEFIQACVLRQGIQPYDCFTVTDLMDDNATRHIKVRASHETFDAKANLSFEVIRLVRQITSRLVDAGVIETVDVGSLPQMRTQEGSPSPQMLAIEKLVREERVYVVRLECLTQLLDQILKSRGIILSGDLDAANDLLSRSRKLADVQLHFLIQLESLALKPYQSFDLLWLQIFRNWANMSKDLYARFVSMEKHAKRALQLVVPLVVRFPTTGGPHNFSTLDAIGSLSMPPQRLQKYRAFLEVNLPSIFPGRADVGSRSSPNTTIPCLSRRPWTWWVRFLQHPGPRRTTWFEMMPRRHCFLHWMQRINHLSVSMESCVYLKMPLPSTAILTAKRMM